MYKHLNLLTQKFIYSTKENSIFFKKKKRNQKLLFASTFSLLFQSISSLYIFLWIYLPLYISFSLDYLHISFLFMYLCSIHVCFCFSHVLYFSINISPHLSLSLSLYLCHRSCCFFPHTMVTYASTLFTCNCNFVDTFHTQMS